MIRALAILLWCGAVLATPSDEYWQEQAVLKSDSSWCHNIADTAKKQACVDLVRTKARDQCMLISRVLWLACINRASSL